MTDIAGYSEFEFDLPEALLRRLISALDAVPAAPLNAEQLASIPDAQGVYQLFLAKAGKPELVYIGKTDSEAGLRRRLLKHARKIRGRLNLDPASVYFKALRVYVFTAIDLESQLIKHYGGVSRVAWNGSGFGANDPGRERDTTRYKEKHFDTQFPIDVDRAIDLQLPAQASAAEILRCVKQGVPYLVRFQTVSQASRVGHADLENTVVRTDGIPNVTAAEIIANVVRQLPTGWHATMLPSHIIIYKDDNRSFPSGRLLARS